MTWFKVDDGLCFHPKAIAAGNSALGLWLRAGSWCGANLTGGWLPAAMIGTLGGQKRDAVKLIHSGLWIHTGPTPEAHQPNMSGTPAAHEVGHEGAMAECLACGMAEGYQFRSWDEYQPTKAQVEADRKAARERQARHREAKRNGVSNGVTDGVTHPVSHATPTRPDPTVVPDGTTSTPRTARKRHIPDDWAPNPAHVAKAVSLGLDLAEEVEKFRDYDRSKGPLWKDFDAAFNNWLRNNAKWGQSPRGPYPSKQQQTDDLFDAAYERALIADQNQRELTR